MKKILLASHGLMAEGISNTLKIFIGECDNIYTVCAYVNQGSEFLQELQKFINSSENDGNTIIFTDIYGGSITQKIIELLIKAGKDIPVVAGANLPLVLSAALSTEKFTKENLQKSFEECKFVLVNLQQEEQFKGEPREDSENDFFE